MRETLGVQFIFVVAVCVAGSCSSRGGDVANPTPKIVVIESGSEPRARVQYEPNVGLAEDIETSTKIRITNIFTNTTLDTGQRGTDFPTSIVRGRLEVIGRSPQGGTLVSFAIEDVGTLEDVVDPRMRQMVNAQAAGLKNTSATWRLLPTGDLAEIKIEMPNAPQAVRAGMSALSDSFAEMFVHFPEADIGIGAIWRFETTTTISSVKWKRTATYRLRELSDGQAVVDVTVDLRAPSQDLGVEPNATTTLKSGEGIITGQAFVPRRGLVTSGSSQTTTEANFLIVQRRLRISSTVRSETFWSVKRIGTNADSSMPATDEPTDGPAIP